MREYVVSALPVEGATLTWRVVSSDRSAAIRTARRAWRADSADRAAAGLPQARGPVRFTAARSKEPIWETDE